MTTIIIIPYLWVDNMHVSVHEDSIWLTGSKLGNQRDVSQHFVETVTQSMLSLQP